MCICSFISIVIFHMEVGGFSNAQFWRPDGVAASGWKPMSSESAVHRTSPLEPRSPATRGFC